MKKHVRPVADGLKIAIGGWHDFRHTVATKMLRSRISPKVVSELLGHADVSITLNTYDHVDVETFRVPLNNVAGQLLQDVTKSAFSDENAVD